MNFVIALLLCCLSVTCLFRISSGLSIKTAPSLTTFASVDHFHQRRQVSVRRRSSIFTSTSEFGEDRTGNHNEGQGYVARRLAIQAFEQPQPWAGSGDKNLTPRDQAKFENKVPFSAETYDVIKRAIELINRRLNEGEVLSTEETGWFTEAIDHIMEDANKYGPPLRPKRDSPKSQ